MKALLALLSAGLVLATISTAATHPQDRRSRETPAARTNVPPVVRRRASAVTGSRHLTWKQLYWRQTRHARDLQHRLGQRVRELHQLRDARTLTNHPADPFYAIRLASSAFGIPYSDMVTVARCETGGTFDPATYNASSTASGIFQFLNSTWARAGLPGFPVWDPIANALAAARLVIADGGWSEWTCKP